MRDKKKILENLDWATRTGLSLKFLSKETDIPYGSIRQFCLSGALGMERRKKLDEWLVAHPEYSEPPALASPQNALASDLRALADILDSPDYPQDFKARKFTAWVKFTFDELVDIADAIGIHKS